MDHDGRETGLEVADFFVLRAASMPLAQFFEWGSGLEAPSLPPGPRRHEALDRDVSLLRSRLREVCAAPAFREALFVAAWRSINSRVRFAPDRLNACGTVDAWRRWPDMPDDAPSPS